MVSSLLSDESAVSATAVRWPLAHQRHGRIEAWHNAGKGCPPKHQRARPTTEGFLGFCTGSAPVIPEGCAEPTMSTRLRCNLGRCFFAATAQVSSRLWHKLRGPPVEKLVRLLCFEGRQARSQLGRYI